MLEKEPKTKALKLTGSCLGMVFRFLPENTEIGPWCSYRSSMAIADWTPGGQPVAYMWLCPPIDTKKGEIKQHLSAVEFDSWLLSGGEKWKAEKLS